MPADQYRRRPSRSRSGHYSCLHEVSLLETELLIGFGDARALAREAAQQVGVWLGPYVAEKTPHTHRRYPDTHRLGFQEDGLASTYLQSADPGAPLEYQQPGLGRSEQHPVRSGRQLDSLKHEVPIGNQ